jgi:hypothetical protein
MLYSRVDSLRNACALPSSPASVLSHSPMQHACTLSAVSHSSIVKVLIPREGALGVSVLRSRFLARPNRLS